MFLQASKSRHTLRPHVPDLEAHKDKRATYESGRVKELSKLKFIENFLTVNQRVGVPSATFLHFLDIWLTRMGIFQGLKPFETG